jgi:tetratricopeptide (TPR) repeat protein/nitrogen fixation-related uncharacterized protein
MTVSRTKLVGIALVIFAVTVWLFWPSVHNGFLTRMDDDEYLRQAVRLNGLTWNAVRWAFTTTQPYYHPLPRLSHVLDYQIWGKNAAGHHATSIVVHALNAALVFGFLWTLLGAASLTTGERLTMALGVALGFASHPFQAESVAWMSGRTQLLCATFGIGCLWAYVAGARRWVVWGLFVAALLCKPMAVSLPFVMLAMDYYPLRRHVQLGWSRLVREKAALVALGVLAAAVTITTESQSGGLSVPLETISPTQRALLMFQSLTFYPWRLVCPMHLSPFYSLRMGLSLDQWPVLVSVLCVGIVTALAVWGRSRLPALVAGWGAYLALVLPVSGLTQSGMQSVALRYAYLAMLPLLLLGGGAVVWAWRRSTTVAQVGVVGLLVCELCVFGLLTRRLIPAWHDDETLWRTVLAKFPDSQVANKLILMALLDQHRADEALEFAQRYAGIMPQLCQSHCDLGLVLARLGRLPDAIGEYEEALRLKPDYAEAHYNLGNALAQTGRIEEAIAHYRQALRLKPNVAMAHKGLGLALERMGKASEAAWQYEEALRIRPDDAEAHNDLGLALKRMGKTPEATGHYEEALRINPDYPEALNNLAWLLATRPPTETGDAVRAVALAERACKLTDNRVATYLDTLAAAYAAAGRFGDAVGTAQKAVEAARAGNESSLAENIEARLQLYRAGHAYYQPADTTTLPPAH